MRMKFEHQLHTNGHGLWSDCATAVRTTSISLAYVDDDESFGELRVYFNPEDWDCDKQGLIYTDPLFIRELCAALEQGGLSSIGIDYSEQGMQGDDYVSLDVGAEFISSWCARYIKD